MNFILSFIASILHVLFLASPSDSYSAHLILLIIRLTTLSILFRNLLLPWLLSVLSKRMRVRSISLTSIRGLYIRTGTQVIRVDRISWSWLHVNGLHVKLQGLNIEVRKAEPPATSPPVRRGNRNLTLADLAPSSFAQRFFAWFYSSSEPFVRPIIRAIVVVCLRALIRWLPNIISNITFEFLSTSLDLPHLLDASISIHGVTFHTELKFTQLGNIADNVEEAAQRPTRRRRLYAMSAWKKRLEDSFQRALDRAWGKAQGTASMKFQMHGVTGTFEKSSSEAAQFLRFPGAVSLAASLKFNPREANIDTNSLIMSLDIEDVYVQLNNLQKLLGAFDQLKGQSLKIPSGVLSPTSPWPLISTTTPIPSSFSVDSERSFFPLSAGLSPGKDTPLSSALGSPALPTSPLLDMLSGSIRARRRPYVPRTPRMKDLKDSSIVAILSRATVKISTIKCAASLLPERELYETTITDISLAASPIKRLPDADFYESMLGSKKKKHDVDPEAYGVNVLIHQIVLARRESLHSLRLLKVGQISLEASAVQWPAPWLKPSPFLKGDPNTPLVSIRLNVEDIQAADRIDHLQKLLDYLRTPKPPKEKPPMTPTLDLPRIALELHCGSFNGRLILIDTSVGPRALEVYTDGLVLSVTSEFVNDQKKLPGSEVDQNRQQLRMVLRPVLILEPVTIQLQPAMTAAFAYSTVDPALADPTNPIAIVSLDRFEFVGDGQLLSFFNPDADSVPSTVLSSAVFDLHLSSDKLRLELWHPDALAIVRRVLDLAMPMTEGDAVDRPRSPPVSVPLLDRLPAGFATTLVFGQIMVMLTSPDIFPSESSGLTRGLALSTGISVQYSSLHTSHTYRFSNLPNQSLLRHKLSLPEEQVVEAFSAAQASAITQRASAHARLTLTSTTVHNVIATANSVIDYQPSRKSNYPQKRILYAKRVTINAHLSGKRGPLPSKADTCQVTVSAPDNRIIWQLADVYAALLVVQAAKHLLPRKKPTQTRPPPTAASIDLHFDLSVGTLQVLCCLPNEKIAVRLDAINLHNQEGGVAIHLPRTVAWVSMPSNVHKWDDDVGEKWEELATLASVHTSISGQTLVGPLLVEAESAKLRIPFGYILANLIQDINISLKAIKHLVRTTTAGVYSDPPNPEAEGPKIVPHLVLKLRYLCVEAADDRLESKLSVIWRCGAESIKHRLEREEAFLAKLEAIAQAYRGDNPSSDDEDSAPEFEFDAEHTVSIEDARRRLDGVHELDWTFRLRALRGRQTEFEEATQQLLGRKQSTKSSAIAPNIVNPVPMRHSPPLFRLTLQNVGLTLQPPSFSMQDLPKFLNENGGLPTATEFSLLIPLNIHLTTSALHATLRDYPLPLLSIASNGKSKAAVFDFSTDLVIAEEMGTEASVDWKICEILKQNEGVDGASGFSFDIPKTIMPVKTYANPSISVKSASPTIICWGVSYTPAIQDFVRIIETLSTPPRDSSPAVGFWDKIRLMLHWKVLIAFSAEVRCHLKGSRDPYKITDDGTGFVLSWRENTQLLINYPNADNELIQVTSGSMYIAIPNLENFDPRHYRHAFTPRTPESDKPFRKICAKLRSGVRFGIGFVLERACGDECDNCNGPAFHRKCRIFDFVPHYKVMLEKKEAVPAIKTPQDSFNGFRSDFIHLSISLQSSTIPGSPMHVPSPSNLHLTPKAFTHFWAWCDLFNGALSLPTRQGSYYPVRTVSPKLGRHLATLKYRIQFPDLYVMHSYIDESRETWADGVAPWIGVKGKVNDLQVDLHQREEELTVPNLLTDGKKVVRRKSLYAAEVSLRNLDLRVLLATFEEPLKRQVEMSTPAQRSNYRSHKGLPVTSPSSPWYDVDDYVETDWITGRRPTVHLLPLVTCPRFTYLNRKGSTNKNITETSKFGLEKSHSCLLGTEESVAQIQSSLVKARIQELRTTLAGARVTGKKRRGSGYTPASVEKMISLLEEYESFLKDTQNDEGSFDQHSTANYLLPFDALSSDEWAAFENVYQVHCPVIFMDAAIRDIVLQYYYCSRARKGFEYHMATRAIKFIRDQAGDMHEDVDLAENPASEKAWGPGATAHMAASALRKIWKGDNPKPSLEVVTEPDEPQDFDPLNGWSEGVSLSKSHCCLLVKPQIVLREEQSKETIVVASVQAKLRNYAIMDDSNVDDHISGKIMSRSYTSISGLQIFAPVGAAMLRETHVPLEVLIDLRCESTEFDRVVPQTDAKFHYDKFNRLRLRNNITSTKHNFGEKDSHLNDQTDLIRVHVPQFTVSANDEHFQAISQIVTKLVLFSDPAHKTRLEKLETLLYTYDFTDLRSAAKLVSELRDQINDALETQRISQNNSNPRLTGEEGQLELLRLQAHIFLLTEELNFIYDAIKLAQDRFDDQTEQRSALLLHASSSQISWRMLDDRKDLLSKLDVEDIDFSWLSRQDSSTGNNLSVGNLQAFDGSRFAVWAEIVSKHYEPANHPLLKRGLFMLASWSVLAPVGGITIYESFELTLHPIRLQIDARVGRRIMEYLWPERKRRNQITDQSPEINILSPTSPGRTSLDSPRGLQSFKPPERVATGISLAPPLRRLSPSRSFTDLRASAKDTLMPPPSFQRQKSSENMRQNSVASEFGEKQKALAKKEGDAAEMKIRASQKTFVMVKISSLHLLLSIAKEGSFECRDAKIRTRDLEYRNQTWSFEELVNQFIPSDTSWRGWVKMAFHQPLLPVLPVARELFSKTKLLGGSKAAPEIDEKGPAPKLPRAKALSGDDDKKVAKLHSRQSSQTKSPVEGDIKPPPLPKITRLPLTDEPEGFASDTETSPSGKSFLSRRKSSGRSGRFRTLLARKSPRTDSSRTSVKSPKSPPASERPSTSSR